ncbi:MAG: BON domain-containing protein [Pseudohongiella sp.]|jgi:hypothetical protein|nr:BON domain-containing protein [Pseudohongiella sp.]
MTNRRLTRLSCLFLFFLIALSACDSGRDADAISSDDQLKAQVEAAFASTSDVPQGLSIEVSQGKAVISGSLSCEDCAGMSTPANYGTIQQSLGAIARAVPGITGVEFSLLATNTE